MNARAFVTPLEQQAPTDFDNLGMYKPRCLHLVLRRIFVLVLFVSLAMGGCRLSGNPAVFGAMPSVAIQPYGGFSAADIETVRTGIARLYAVTVVVLPSRPLPESAYYEPRKRYRATKLLEDLDGLPDAPSSKILGLTRADISVTKGDIPDWGIFGLGSIGGRPCVVSVFRLGREKVSQALFEDRLVKVVNHELGHTFGLGHCETPGCLMEDAGGTMASVDSEAHRPCEKCLQRLREAGVLRELQEAR